MIHELNLTFMESFLCMWSSCECMFNMRSFDFVHLL